MAGPTYVASGYVNASSGASTTLTKPASLTAGRTLTIFYISISSGGGVQTPASGFSSNGSESYTSGATFTTGVFTKVAGGSEPANYTFTCSGTGLAGSITWVVSDGVDATTPVLVCTHNSNTTNPASSNTFPSTTTGAITDTLVYRIGNPNYNATIGGSDFPNQTLSGYTNNYNGAADSITTGIQSIAQAGAGAVSSLTATTAGSGSGTSSWSGFTLVMQGPTAPPSTYTLTAAGGSVALTGEDAALVATGARFRSAGTFAAGTGAVTPGLPAGYLADDIFLLFAESANQTITAPSGYTAVTNSPQGTGTAAGTTATLLAVFWKRASGSETAPTVADAGDHTCAQILAFSGCVTTGNPWDVTAGDVAATASASVTMPGATTTVAQALIVQAIATATDIGTPRITSEANAALTDLTEWADNASTQGNGGGIAVFGGRLPAAGAIGGTTATAATSTVQGRMTIALKAPASSGSPYTLTASAGGYTETGQAVVLRTGRVVPAASGSYALSGQAVTLRKGFRFAAVAGSYALSGQAATLRATRTLSAASGAYTLTGQAATLTYTPVGIGYTLTAAAGSYALGGQTVTLRAARKLSATAGSYALTGQTAALRRTRVLGASSGSYSLSGQAVTLRFARKFSAASGSYSLSGQAVGLRRGHTLSSAPGAYALSGQSISFRRTYVLGGAAGAYALDGSEAAFHWSGQQLWTPVAPNAEAWTTQSATAEIWTPVPPNPEPWTSQ